MQRPGWVREDLFPFRSRFVEADGARIHHIDEGEGPVFLMLHGNPTWSFLYRHIVNGLRDRFRCVAVDHPGFGLSTAGPGYGYTIHEHAHVLDDFIDAVGLTDITLMVQDWGGPIGLHAVVHRPELFRALVIGNTWAWPAQGDKQFERFSKLLGSSFPGGLLVKQLDIFTRVFLKGGMTRRKLSPAELEMYRRPHPTPASRVPVHVMPREILAARDHLAEVEEELPKVAHLPVLIVWGDRDRGFQERHLRRWQSIFPNARTVVLKGAGHYIQEDAPDEIVSAVKQWWPGQ